MLENTDFTAPDLRARAGRASARPRAPRATPASPATELADALLPVLLTPLGPLAGGLRLADIGRADRLDELDFELPLAGGDDPAGDGDRRPDRRRCCAGTCRPTTRCAATPATWPRRCSADRSLRGFLTGSIDLVLRVRDAQGTPRYLVVDYKTNWLGGASR